MKRTHFSQDTNSGSCPAAGKSNMVGCEPEVKQIDAGFDEHFAVLGYNVKSSDMASVAQKIEQLEVMGSSAELDAGQGPELASENFHYNPSDLSSWLESMICDFNPLPEFNSSTTTAALDPLLESTRTLVESGFGTGLISILDQAVYPRIRLLPPPSSPPRQKKMKMAPYSGNSGVLTWASPEEPATRSLVLIDSQENGIRLVHTLMACAEAVQHDNKKLAEVLVKNIGFLALSQVGAMRKVATYFAEALASRIYDLHPANPPDPSFTDMLQMHFYAACPYLKFAHFTANRAILEALEGKNRVHVIDFGIKQGMQWPELLQALAVRPGGPPAFRLTGLALPHPKTPIICVR